MTRKKYSAEFKIKIIDLVEKKGNKVSQVAEKYFIETSIIRRWIKEYKSAKGNKEKLFPGNGNPKNMENKIKRYNERKKSIKNKILNDSKKLFTKKSTLNDYFEFIYKNKEKYLIIYMVEVFKINRSSYYKWVNRNKKD